MIEAIHGTLLTIHEDGLLIRTGYVSWKVFCPRSLLTSVAVNQEISLHTHLHVREDNLSLFGFASEKELALFRLLISVSGIGPKIALEILSAGVDMVVSALMNKDIALLSSIKGIGKKTAERTCIELGEKVSSLSGGIAENHLGNHEYLADASLALEGLGWKKSEIAQKIRSLPKGIETAEEIVRWFLTQQ